MSHPRGSLYEEDMRERERDRARQYSSSGIGSSAPRSSVSHASRFTYGPSSSSSDKMIVPGGTPSSYRDDDGLARSVASMRLSDTKGSVSNVGSKAGSTYSSSTIKPSKSHAGSVVPSRVSDSVSPRERASRAGANSTYSSSTVRSSNSRAEGKAPPLGNALILSRGDGGYPARRSVAPSASGTGSRALDPIPEGSRYSSQVGPVSRPLPRAREKATVSIERGIDSKGRPYIEREMSVERNDGDTYEFSKHRHRRTRRHREDDDRDDD